MKPVNKLSEILQCLSHFYYIVKKVYLLFSQSIDGVTVPVD